MTLDCTCEGPIATITLNRPQALNAITAEMIVAFEQALDAVEAGDAAALLVAGAGRGFCAGSDLKEAAADPVARLARMHRLILRLRAFSRPVIAVLHGPVLGGGLELALACTFRLAHPSARLGLPEICLGAIPAYGGTQLLPRLIGEARALDMMLSGEAVDAARGHEIGLVDHLLPDESDPLAAARRFAERYTKHSRVAARAIVEATRAGQELPLAEGLRLEIKHVLAVTAREEFVHALARFRDKGAAGIGTP